MYYCVDCKKHFDNIVIERESCGVDNMSGTVEYYYCPLCGSSHTGEEYKKVEEDEDE